MTPTGQLLHASSQFTCPHDETSGTGMGGNDGAKVRASFMIVMRLSVTMNFLNMNVLDVRVQAILVVVVAAQGSWEESIVGWSSCC